MEKAILMQNMVMNVRNVKMNSAVQTLLKTLSNLESQEKQIISQIDTCEKELIGWKKDLIVLLAQKAEIQLAISLLEGNKNEQTTSKKTSSKRKNSN